MKSVRILVCILFAFAAVSAYAQTQKGYVKTLGRPEKKGVPLYGVSIRAAGAHNAVLSDEEGFFSLLLPDKKNGDAYTLQQVQKNGYELNETAIIGRPYAFSDKVPLTLVMVSTAEFYADKQRIENNAYRVAEKNYKAKQAQLEQLRDDKQLTAEKYREELLSLQDKFEKYQSLIDGLAEHYAHTDYDELTDTEREINICIENGDLERADSLIHTLFDPIEVLQRNKEALSAIDRQIAQARDIMAQADADMAAVLRQQEKDAEYLYQLYTIALARFDNEKAQYYIETRAALDTTNVDWQLESGEFICNYIADYDKALRYYTRALRNAINRYGENHKDVATSYNNIGVVYCEQGDYSRALEYYKKALIICKYIYGENHKDVATSYNNIGGVYSEQGDYTQAWEYLEKALAIKELFGENHPAMATSYNNIGRVYDSQGNYARALEYYEKSLEIQKEIVGENHPNVAVSYGNIGLVYYHQGDYSHALEFCEKALEIQKSIFGETHPHIATSYGNIGLVYNNQGDYSHALEFCEKALTIYKDIVDENHPDVAINYNNIGLVYNNQGDYSHALESYEKALEIQKGIFGENHPDVATSYNNIGNVCDSQGDYPRALAYYERALAIWQNVFGENHPNVATSYNNIGGVYYDQGDYARALEYLEKSLAIDKEFFDENHPDMAITYSNMEEVCNRMGDYKKAMEYHVKAVMIKARQ